MSRTVTIDLDDPDAQILERLWAELEARHASRNSDPELYDGVARCLDAAEHAGRLTAAGAEVIRAEMAGAHPAAVLEAHWRALVADRPAVGAFLTA
ncbi:MAG TPA: hypothetical protein VME20_05960 [Acidimicrobiales bacterium]|nr:hypothetical protein [Acidimicrobiales bacterium]